MRHRRGQRRYVAAVGAYLREGEPERCAADVGQPPYCETPLDRSIVGEYGTAYLAGEIAHRTVERHIHVAQSLPPCTYRRCECGDVVGRDGRILQLADHPHVLDEVLVTSPVATLDRHRGHENRGLRRIYRESVETDDTPVDEEIAVHVVDRKAALLGGGQRYYIAPYLVAHHSEVFQAGVPYIDQHIVEVDSRGRVAVHQTLHSEGQIVDIDMIDIHPEITLAVLAREAVDDLLDVHLARRRLTQIEPDAGGLGRGYFKSRLLDIESREAPLDLGGIEQRILLVVLDIEAADAHAGEQIQIDTVDLDARFQLAREERHGTVDDIVLHRGYVEQQRSAYRQKYQQQNDCR